MTTPIKSTSLKGLKVVEINNDSKELNVTIKKHDILIYLSYLKNLFDKDLKYLCVLNQYFTTKIFFIKVGFNLSFLESDKFIYEVISFKKGKDLVLEIAKRTNCATNLSGKGFQNFINPQTFLSSGTNFIYHDYKPIKYNQNNHGIILEILSIIDALLNLVSSGTRNFLIKI